MLKGAAAGKTDMEMAEEEGVPVTTISGRRSRIRQKLGVSSTEAAIAKAMDIGLLNPDDPTSAMLLAAYEKLASPQYDHLRMKSGLKKPTERQIQYMRLWIEGATTQEAADLMGIGLAAAINLRIRIWQIVGANSPRTALRRVQELDVLTWNPETQDREGRLWPRTDEQATAARVL